MGAAPFLAGEGANKSESLLDNLEPDQLNSNNSFLISAGEASGETYGAELIAALRSLAPGATFFGLGGDKMSALGFESVVDTRDVAVVGLAEVVSHLPSIYGHFRRLLKEVDRRRPTAAILIDFPDFNFRLAKKLHARGIPVFYYVSPQLWAWRQGRISLVRKYVRKMLVIFPFEEEFYRQRGIEVEYLGHPLADVPPPSCSRQNFAAEVGLNPDKQWIALLPGSRRKEVTMNFPEMLRAAAKLGEDYEFVVPIAPTLDAGWMKALVEQQGAGSAPTIHYCRDARGALAHSRAAVVASGTATVEAALIGTPFVVVYRVSNLTYRLGRRFVNVPHFAMVNLIAGRRIVPELIQADFTGDRVTSELRKILDDGVPRSAMLQDLAEVRSRLHPAEPAVTAAQRAAHAIMQELRH